MKIRLAEKAFDPWQELARHQSEQPALAGKFGATAVFIGTLRDFNQGSAVQAMTLEHYAPMTQKHLERVAGEAGSRWPIEDVLVIHRYGELRPNEPIVCVGVWAAHRDAAFAACRHIIDELKARAPFWKQEMTEQGRRWVAPE
ncbi:MAG: molybdenum cofactor biosynthesis protein MoaE [Gammaproteobacteria bacterium]|nr:molybdenum cofactor biosynthesis protein MoaE [Gammaproteobacteria bacterium]MDH5512902.1 molybdenum cofactor biosynthesis protein MoaE [Gammaproteobacteria bacterium]